MASVASPLQRAWPLLRTTAKEWAAGSASRHAAALAFYTAFSLAPLLLLILTISGWVVGTEAARAQIVAQLQAMMGPTAADFIETVLDKAQNASKQGFVAAIAGAVGLFIGATSVLSELQSSLNTIWRVDSGNIARRPHRGGILGLILKRILSFGMILSIGFLMLVSLAVTTALSSFAKWTFGETAQAAWIMSGANFALSFLVTMALFALIFKVLPDIDIAWRDVWQGAFFTSLLFSVGRYAIGVYLAHNSTVSLFGAAGSLLVLLIWIYYSAQILFFGAIFTQVEARGTEPQAAVPAMPDEEMAGAAPFGLVAQDPSQVPIMGRPRRIPPPQFSSRSVRPRVRFIDVLVSALVLTLTWRRGKRHS